MSQSKKCPCGSGKSYKSCCGKNPSIVTPNSIHSSAQKEISQIVASEKKATKHLKHCCWPGCESTDTIRAHTISESFLNRISVNGHVLHFRHLIDDVRSRSKRNGKPKPIGVKQASTFFGYCDPHDKYFMPIDGQWTESSENFFLHAYRITSYNYYRAKLNQKKAINSIGEHKLKFTPSPDYVDNRIADNMYGYLATDVFNNTVAKEQLEFMYTNTDYSDLESYVCYFDADLTISAAMTFPCFIYFDGNRQSVSVYEIAETPQVHLTLVPLTVGGVLIVTWHKNVSQFARVQWETFEKIPNSSKSDVLLRMLFHWSGGTVLSPTWWNGLSHAKRGYLSKIVKNYSNMSIDGHISTDVMNANGRYTTKVVDWCARDGDFHNTGD